MNSTLTDVTAITQRLIAFDTVNPPGREREAAEYCAQLLSRAGFECRIVDHGQNRASLVAQRGAAPGLCFSGHLDTVPLGRVDWRRPAHLGVVEGDRLFGRGSSDMKGGVAAFLVAAARSNAPVSVVLAAGEETGCDGARWLAEAGDLPQARAVIVGESTDNNPLAGHKGALWLNLVSRGQTAHGATPELGVNAIAGMAETLRRLCAFDPAVSHPQMGRATCNLGTIRAGINVNSVPDLCELTVDLRSVEGVTHEALTQKVRALCDAAIEIETLLDLPSVWTDPASPWFAGAAERVRAITGREGGPECATYFTDASILKSAMGGPEVMILGPGAPDQPHRTDEYVSTARLHEAVEIYAALIEESA
ncbi:M20 family metallopeptidase [Tropicimonas aquimaris]|uniref:M20 family metallopeptidase n=1 Tax=Tropicimonas aquimaris TaxID=914152 RepID=A0ABW3IYL4_9RHOB